MKHLMLWVQDIMLRIATEVLCRSLLAARLYISLALYNDETAANFAVFFLSSTKLKNRRTTCIKTGTKNMGKQFPRFLISNATNTKSKGPFIIHTLPPKFICKPLFDAKRNLVDLTAIEMFNEEDAKLKHVKSAKVFDDMREWYRYSGVHQSDNLEDKIVSDIYSLQFLKEEALTDFTVEQVRDVIKIILPTKAKTIYNGSSSYGLKHFMEHISQTVLGNGRINKYCSNDVLKDAFELEKFRHMEEGPNRYYNILASELNRAKKLFWNT